MKNGIRFDIQEMFESLNSFELAWELTLFVVTLFDSQQPKS